jgi:hypothetical protein
MSFVYLADVTSQVGNCSSDAPHSVITTTRQPTTLELMAQQCLGFTGEWSKRLE